MMHVYLTPDGQFVFAVTSDRIYCRPSCPSRRAHRERVKFFDLPGGRNRLVFVRACVANYERASQIRRSISCNAFVVC